MRPIVTSDSCNTLVDLNDEHHKIISSTDAHLPLVEQNELIQSHILLPRDDDSFDDDEEDELYNAFIQQPTRETPQYLYLPSSSSETPVDKHLSAIPTVVENAEMLLANPPRLLSSHTSSRVLNICQGEIGHATPSQCDVIVSDKTTTCHIVAVRSTVMDGMSTPLASLAHIDREGHEDCLRAMIREHKSHHFSNEEEEKKEEDAAADQRIQMDLHIMGGFNDEDQSSIKISESLMDIFARIAEEEASTLQITLQTCAISTLNDNGLSCPIGRGLGMDLKSGQVFLASVDESVAGPATTLRSVRLWTGGASRDQLSVVHTSQSDTINVSPFQYEEIENTDIIVSLPDHVILQHTSTSPDVEADGFCDDVRRTLSFMKDTECTNVFGMKCDKPVVYRRCHGNVWVAQE